MMNRAKNENLGGPHCSKCGSPVGQASLCSCGKPTANMSFAERTAWEVEQYKAYKARVASA